MNLIEQHKSEAVEPVAYTDSDNNYLEWTIEALCEKAVCSKNDAIPLYAAPQPTPQDGIDAERWWKLRSLICNGMSGVAVTYFAGTDFHTVQDAEMLDSVIDQAMKGA